jgi:hypothetical protein
MKAFEGVLNISECNLGESMGDEARKRFPSRKHEQPVAGSAKSRTQARVVTQAAPVTVSGGKIKSSKKHAKTDGGRQGLNLKS